MNQVYGHTIGIMQKGTVDGMDNFMDKLAQKFSAQELIKANSQAEAEEMKRLQIQVAEYEKILQEMRKLNYKNTELSEKLDRMIGDNAGKIQGMKEDEQKLITALRDLTDEQTRNREAELAKKESERVAKEQEDEIKRASDLEAISSLLEKKFERSEDFVHKENVKVYRNVQAVVVDELKNYTQSAQTDRDKFNTKLNRAVLFSLVAMLASIVSMVVSALIAAGIIK